MTTTGAEHPEHPQHPHRLQQPSGADLHALLLGLAGRVPDEKLAEMRFCLADGEEHELAALLETRPTGREAPLVPDPTRERDGTPAAAPPSPYRFGDRYGIAIPAGDGWEATTDAADDAVIEAVRRAGEPNAVWRVFRHSGEEPPRRVHLVETGPGADLAELTAEAQYALSEVAPDTPRVEVFAEGMPLPRYHETALQGATLVWAAFDVTVRLARAFDGADARGPFFHDDHPRLGGEDGERVLAYLRSGELVLDVPGGLDDVLDPGRAGAVPAGFRSDGRWVWPEATAYYLKRHGLAPEPDLVAHALAGAPGPLQLNRLTRHRALTALFEPAAGEPVWQAG